MNTSSADRTHHLETRSERARPSTAQRTKVGVAAVLVLLGTFAGLTLAGVTPVAASTLNGVATITNPVTNRPLTSGGSTTQFTVSLPKVGTLPAHCTADTATHGYLVFSYMVHQGVKPTSVSFANGFPSTGYGFVTSTGEYYGKANTAVKTGQIVEIPNNLEFAPLLSKGLSLDTLLYAAGNKTGAWDAGIACAKNGVVSDYWNTPVNFTASTTDPNKFVWSNSCTPEPAVFHSAASARFIHGRTNKFSVVVTGCPAPVITESGKLPTGVTLSKTGGILSGNPAVGGVFKFSFLAKVGSAKAVSQAFTLTVPLFVATAALPSAKPGAAYKATAVRASGGKAPYAWTSSKLPSGLKLSSGGVLSGTLAKTVKAGSDRVEFKVTDHSSPKETATAVLVIKVT
ncbi:MAG: putative Ig domain-containing protein [Acidimicrobiales bacterium]|jgi:hypothetical protein